MDFKSEVGSGDLRRALEAQREDLAGCLESCKPGEAAPLHARLTDVLTRLDALAVPAGSRLDELAAARRKRRTGS